MSIAGLLAPFVLGITGSPTLLVFGQPSKVEMSSTEVLVGIVAQRLTQTLGKGVLTDQDVGAVYGEEPVRALHDCVATSCTLEVAGALNLHYVVSLAVLPIGHQYTALATVIDSHSAHVQLRTERRFSQTGEIIDVASEVAERITAALSKTVHIHVEQWVDVYVDDRAIPVAVARMGRFTLRLSFGVHRLRFRNSYAQPYAIELAVGPDSPRRDILVRLQRRWRDR